jgi:hypothetical protein
MLRNPSFIGGFFSVDAEKMFFFAIELPIIPREWLKSFKK